MRDSSTSWRSVGRFEDMILPGREDPHNCMDARSLGKSEWDQRLRKIECVLSLYDMMRWKWVDIYLPRSLQNIYYALLIAPPLPRYPRTPTVAPWHCSWSLWSSEFRDAFVGRDQVNWEIHSEAAIERVCWCNWGPRFSEPRDTHQGHDRTSLQMQLETEIQSAQRYTMSRWSSEFGDAFGDRDWVNSEIYSKDVIEHVWRWNWRPPFGDLRDAFGGRDRAALEMRLRLWSSDIGSVLCRDLFGAMIPPLRAIPVYGRAQSGPVQWEGRTGRITRLAVLDRPGLVWTDPCTDIVMTLLFSQVLLKRWLILTFDHHSPLNTHSDRNYSTSVCIFVFIKMYFPKLKNN